jgi:hypothetical protein
MTVNLLLGLLALAYGLYTLYARSATPEKFAKLEAMKERWGEQNGNLLHLVSYSIVPIAVGLVLVGRALLG